MTLSGRISAHWGRREEYLIKEERSGHGGEREKERESNFSPSLSLVMV